MKRTLVFLALSTSLTFAEPVWRELFDGETLAGWTNGKGDAAKEGGWMMEDGVLHRKGPGGDLLSAEEFGDFELSFDWKISKGGNSGVKYRVRPDLLGLEYQVLDDEGHPDAKNGDNRHSASLYDLKAAASKELKPVGEWNSALIVVKDGVVTHFLNGKQVVQITIPSEEWTKAFEASKYKDKEGFGTNEKGRLLIQDHGNEVWYRNFRIRTE